MTQLDLLPVDVRPLPAPGDLCWFRQDGRACALLVRRLDGGVVVGQAVDGMRRLPTRSVVASVRDLGGTR